MRAFDSTRAFHGGECQAWPDLPTGELYHGGAARTIAVMAARGAYFASAGGLSRALKSLLNFSTLGRMTNSQ